MERRFCQSGGRPLGDETLLETESSGKNAGNIVFIASKRALSPRPAWWGKWRMPAGAIAGKKAGQSSAV